MITELAKEGNLLTSHLRVALGFFERFLGLMGRKDMPSEEALLFPRCNSIHTFFMRFPIDVILLDKEGTVVEIIPAMAPWRMILPRFKAKHVIEMRAGRAGELGIERGNRLDCKGALR